jgi:hypothetical protein
LEKPEGKRPLGRPKYRLGENIRMKMREEEWEVVNWIHLVQDRNQWQVLVNMVMKLWVP